MRDRYHHYLQQSGQAVIEAVIAALALTALWWAITWLARLQDFSLHVHHGVRYAAFALSREGLLNNKRVDAAWQALPRQWVTPNQGSLLAIYGQRDWQLQQLAPAATKDQPGGNYRPALVMSQELGTADDGAWKVAHRLTPAYQDGLAPFPTIHRTLAIAIGAGHAESDRSTREIVEQSATTWQQPFSTSRRLSEQIAGGASGVDAGWKRPAPTTRWLELWEAEVP